MAALALLILHSTCTIRTGHTPLMQICAVKRTGSLNRYNLYPAIQDEFWNYSK